MAVSRSPSPDVLRFSRPAAWLAFAGLLGGCAVGPNYRRPEVSTPPAFREAPPGWKEAAPQDAALRGPWWVAFNDPVLNDLENQAAVANLSLRQAEANFEQSRQLARSDLAGILPTISADGSAERSKNAAASQFGTTTARAVNTYSASLAGSWQLDLWGRVRRQVESDVASAESDAALLASTRLSLQSTLAEDYIQLRVLDEKRQLLDNAVEAYRRTLQISKNKYGVGVAARSDVVSAQAQLDATRAQAVDVGAQRAELEHAIAVLVGKEPAEFTLERRAALGLAQPAVPAVLPSELLERRPDVAQAEREAIAANAKIGIQIAQYFPTISLSASGGYTGNSLSHLFELPNRMWSLGASGSELLFTAGARGDEVRAARAAFDAAAAGYRQSVLTAFQQVEDGLSSVRILDEEAAIQETAVKEAADASRIALNEYREGTVDYTTVDTAQIAELNDRESALSTVENQLIARVALIQALGGGWTSADLPTTRQVLARHVDYGVDPSLHPSSQSR